MKRTHEHHDRPLIADGESYRVPLFKWLFAVPRFLFKLWFGIAPAPASALAVCRRAVEARG